MKEKNLVFPVYLIPVIKKLDLSFKDFILLMYFWNITTTFDLTEISSVIKMNEKEIMNAFNSLVKKKVITLETCKDNNGKIKEKVNLDLFYMLVQEELESASESAEMNDVYSIFEREFGRPLSSTEYEIIHTWISKGFKEELIIGALKEAVYNGVCNFRYIDTILYEWKKKGYKTMKDVRKLPKKDQEETPKLFDYDWLDDDE